MNLVEYGIATENSDIRAHVSLPGRRVTVYRTRDMVALIECGAYPSKSGYQKNIEYATARGVLVPIDDIQPQYVLRSDSFPWCSWTHETMDCKARGEMAVVCVRAAIRSNLFPLWVCGRVTSDAELDIQGTDLIVSASRRVQVKYDSLAYPRDEGGSGNLYVQTHECNPFKLY